MSEEIIDDIIHDLEALDFNSQEARDVVSNALQAKEKEMKEEIAREVEELIQKERFAGAPHALNEVIAIINKK